MTRQWIRAAAVAAAGSVWAMPALALNAEQYRIPYVGVAGEYGMTDSARDAGHLAGFQLSAGLPLSHKNQAVELRFFDSAINHRSADGKKDYQSGLFADYVYDFGPTPSVNDGFFSYYKPYVAAGLGVLQEDVAAQKRTHVGVALGGGVIAPIGWKGWALRLDARLQPQMNRDSEPPGHEKSYLIDYIVNLGVQIPLTIFFDRPIAMDAAGDCTIAVVDPVTGRRDCDADGDGDGVPDSKDQCPGTPPGTVVDEKGCPKALEIASDDDGDGVPNARDACPGTPAGLLVDEHGCIVAQKSAVRGVSFMDNSARLTAESRKVLDGVAAALKQQARLKMEIAGHTDNAGSSAYSQLLSQQRADAVRTYLVDKGVDGARLSAVGYGASEPLAANDTDSGRSVNQRVEFRITAD